MSFAPNISSQYMVPLIWVNRYSHKVFSPITCSKILFSSIKWQRIWLQRLQNISLSLTSNWRNWTVSKNQKANKKASCSSLHRSLSLPVNEAKWFATLIGWRLWYTKGNQKTLKWLTEDQLSAVWNILVSLLRLSTMWLLTEDGFAFNP